MSEHSAEEVKKHVRIYVAVFAALAVLTVVTVAVSYLKLPTSTAIALALLIATIKGSLVALYFMHLISEQKAIVWLLGLTASFFLVCMYVPGKWTTNTIKVGSVWDNAVPAAHVEAGHDGDGDHGDDGHH